MKNLRDLLLVEPIVDGMPLYRSMRELAKDISELPEKNKFSGKANFANSALNAIARGERPFSAEVKDVVISAITRRVGTQGAGSRIIELLQQIPSTSKLHPRDPNMDLFNLAYHQLERASDALIIRPMQQPGAAAESHPMRGLLFEKLGIFKSARALATNTLKSSLYASARMSFVVGSEEHARRGWESFFMQAVGASTEHPMGDREVLDIDEAMARFAALDDYDLLRIYSVDPSLCSIPVQVYNPASDSLAEGWVIFYCSGGAVSATQFPQEFLASFQGYFIGGLESGTLVNQKRIRWAEIDQSALVNRAHSLRLARGLGGEEPTKRPTRA